MDDLRDQGERVSENRVARLSSLAGIAAQIGYKRRPGRYGGQPAVVAENKLNQKFQASQPDQVWVTDITYIKTHEGWLYLCVVIDLFSRRVVVWSAQSRMTTDLALQALLMSVWRRKPDGKVTVHSPSRALLRNTLPGSGSGITVHQQGVAVVPGPAQPRTKYEPPSKLPSLSCM